MTKKNLRIIFMGTPEFAVASLEAIKNSEHDVVAVVTVPDKPAGRGQKISESAVKKYAITHSLPLLQPEKLKNKEFINNIKNLSPDVIVVVAYRLLPKEIWQIPKLGTFNLHASLLPQYRGAAPINYAIINGDEQSGITTFFIDDKIDTGQILLQEKVDIPPTYTAGDLHDVLMEKGAILTLKTLDGLAIQSLSPINQVESKNIRYATKIFKENCLIEWNKSLKDIHNHIRGLSPYPTAYTHMKIGNKNIALKIYMGKPEYIVHELPPKRIIKDQHGLKISHKEGFYILSEIQPEGKKRMPIKDFINGLQKNTPLELID